MKPSETPNKILSPSLVYNVDVGKITNRYDYSSTTNRKSMFGSMSSSIQSFSDEYSTYFRIGKLILAHVLVVGYFSWATVYFFKHSEQTSKLNSCIIIPVSHAKYKKSSFILEIHDAKCENVFCNGYGMLFLLMATIYGFLFYFKIIKPSFGRSISRTTTYIKWQLNDFFGEKR